MRDAGVQTVSNINTLKLHFKTKNPIPPGGTTGANIRLSTFEDNHLLWGYSSIVSEEFVHWHYRSDSTWKSRLQP